MKTVIFNCHFHLAIPKKKKWQEMLMTHAVMLEQF